MVSLALVPILQTGLPLVILAGLAMYVASKALSGAIAGERKTAGRIAIGQWMPIAAVALAAIFMHRPAVAMGLIFSSSIACICLATGAVATVGLFPAPCVRRSWGMLLPVALLASIAGFKGSITLPIAGVFALQGLAILLLWNDSETPSNEPVPVESADESPVFRVIQFVLAALVTGLGAWLALHGIREVSSENEFASAGLLAATLLSPLLILPIIGSGTDLAQRNRKSTAVDAQMGVVLLNICLLLPLVVVSWHLSQWIDSLHLTNNLIATTAPAIVDFRPLPFPLGVWRVDVVMLVALGLFVMPVALGRWSLSKWQGLGMMAGYAVYLYLAISYQSFILYGVKANSTP